MNNYPTYEQASEAKERHIPGVRFHVPIIVSVSQHFTVLGSLGGVCLAKRVVSNRSVGDALSGGAGIFCIL